MGDHLNLLGALVATQNITVDDAVMISEYCDMADENGFDPSTLMSAIDQALGFFRPPPDVDAARTAITEAAEHDDGRGTCPDCGEPSMMDEVDYEQAIDLWIAVRGVVDKYQFDRDCAGQEEC